MRTWILAAALAAVSTAASAQAPRATAVRVAGVITAATPTSVTIKPATGEASTVTLAKSGQVIVARPVNIEAIKPGAYVATANTNIDASSGKSIELRMYDPTAKGAEFSRPMAQPNTTMTNGTVQGVKKGAGGRELTVYIPGGSRTIIVPPDVKVIGNYPGSVRDLKVGANVTANAARAPSGELIASRITVNRQ